MLASVDESYNYVSDPNAFYEHYIVNRAHDVVKQGHKDKLDVFMITYNPEDATVTSSNKPTPTSFLASAKKSSPKSPPSLAATNKTSKKDGKGQAVIKAPNVEAVEVKRLPYCLTQHSN